MKNIFTPILILCLSIQVGQSQQTVGLFLNDSLSENGYTLFSVRNDAYLIDNCGFLVNQWTSLYSPGLSLYLLENGNLLRTGRVPGNFSGGGIGGRVELFSWEGDLLWGADYATPVYHQHHDIEPLPNGNILLIAWEKYTYAEAVMEGREPDLTPNGGVWPDKVVEIEMVGSDDFNVVWEWHAWDHMIQEFDSTKNNYGVVADHPELLDANYKAFSNSGPANTGSDWLHSNAVGYNAELDQIVISSRHWSEIWVIDHSTTTEEAAGHTGGNSGMGGDILYRYGNPEAYNRGDIFNKMFFGQHDAKWVAAGYPNEGKISVFNNGQGRPAGNYSSIDMIEPPLNSDGTYDIDPGQPYGPANLHWTYEANPPESFYSSNISGAHALPNGNVLICDGNAPRFFEVGPDGALHWDYVSPLLTNGNPVPQESTQQTADVFRATRYADDYAAFDGKDLTPGEPIELDPVDYGCQIYNGIVSTHDLALKGLKVYPNPAADYLQFEWDGEAPLSLAVYDVLGRYRETVTVQSNTTIDVSQWERGHYILKAETGGYMRVMVMR